MSASGAEPVAWRAVLTGPNAGLFTILCFGVWLNAADSTVIATLLPPIIDDIGGEALVSLTYVLYRLANIVALCCGALVAQSVGLRGAMVVCSLTVALGCLVSAVTPSMEFMLVGRAIQGFGGGMLVALTTIGATKLFPSHYTPRIMAAISAVWGSSAFLGPLVGGIFAEFGYWRLGFWAFVVQALLLAVALRWILPPDEKVEAKQTRLPWRRLGLLSAAILSIAFAGLETESPGLIAVLCAFGAIALAYFLRLDRDAPDTDRLLPRAVTDLGHTAGQGLGVIFLIATGGIAFTVYGPVLVSKIHDVGPLAAGYMIALESVSWTLGALFFSGVAGRRQVYLIRAAIWLLGIGGAGLALFVSSGPVWLIPVFLFLMGLGFGACFGHILQNCVETVPTEDKERAAGAINSVQIIGYSLGAAICGIAANTVGFGDGATPETARAAADWMFVVMLPILGAAILLVHRFPGRGVSEAPAP